MYWYKVNRTTILFLFIYVILVYNDCTYMVRIFSKLKFIFHKKLSAAVRLESKNSYILVGRPQVLVDQRPNHLNYQMVLPLEVLEGPKGLLFSKMVVVEKNLKCGSVPKPRAPKPSTPSLLLLYY
jgi:hypothetical protein